MKKVRNIGYYQGVAFGALISSVLIFTSMFLLDVRDDEFWRDVVFNILTLIGSLIAALIALWGVRHQIETNNEHEKSRIERAGRAARASLPNSLSELSRIFCDQMRWHFSTDDWNEPIEVTPHFDIIAKCIEFADPQSAERLAGIIRTYQPLIARLRGAEWLQVSIAGSKKNEWGTGRYQKTASAVNWAVLHARVSQSFLYARGQSQKIPKIAIDKSAVCSSFHIIEEMPENYPLLSQMICIRDSENQLEMRFIE